MIRRISAMTALLLLLIATTSDVSADQFYSNLANFFQQTFPGEGFVPTPYGADDRFAPKTIWIYLPHVAGKPWKNNKEKAWVAFSNGRAIYPDAIVEVKRRPINTQTWKLEGKTKWALAAALNGQVTGTAVDADIDFVHSKNLTLDIDLGETEVEYGYYFDFLHAQVVNQQTLQAMSTLLSQRFGEGNIPDRRVVIAALRVRNANITAKPESSTSIGAEVVAALQRLGFSWNSEKKVAQSLKTDQWRYIAYQALISDKAGRISSASETAGGQDFAYADENSNAALMKLLSAP